MHGTRAVGLSLPHTGLTDKLGCDLLLRKVRRRRCNKTGFITRRQNRYTIEILTSEQFELGRDLRSRVRYSEWHSREERRQERAFRLTRRNVHRVARLYAFMGTETFMRILFLKKEKAYISDV